MPVEVRTKFIGHTKSAVAHADLRPFLEAARLAQNSALDVRVHAVGEKFVVHAATDNQLSSCVVAKAGPQLQLLLQRLKKTHGSFRLTLISDQMADVLKIASVPATQGLAVETERMHERRFRRGREIRNILVMTNISGPALPGLDANLSFWSKGMPGYRFRHIYGQLTARRVEAALAGREWDSIVYRGHGSVQNGAVVWNLSDGEWQVPKLSCVLYIHSACLAEPGGLDLTQLPAKNILTPLAYLADFDDAPLVALLLGRYKITGSLAAAVRGVQRVFPQFVSIASGF